MYKFIAMHCGYAESCKTSLLVYNCRFFGISGYKLMKDAITDLAFDLYHKFHNECLSIYENRYLFGLSDCCRESLIKDHDAKFCSKCGSQLKDKDFDPESFTNFIRELHDTDSDSYGDADEGNFHWYPFWTEAFIGASKKSIIYIAENAESVLLHALFDAKPELRTKEYSLNVFPDWEKFKNEQDPYNPE